MAQTQAQAHERVNLHIPVSSAQRLRKIAADERRSLSAQVSLLIDLAYLQHVQQQEIG